MALMLESVRDAGEASLETGSVELHHAQPEDRESLREPERA